MTKLARLFLTLPLVFLLACASSNDNGDTTSNANLLESLGIIGESIHTIAAASVRHSEHSACSSLGFSTCSAQIRTRSFSADGGDTDGCTRGTAHVYGKAILSFSHSSCSEAVSHTITRTLSNHYFSLESGTKILIYTDVANPVAGQTLSTADLKDFEGVSRSGGALLTKGSDSDTLAITGIHRRSLSAKGAFVFWHTLYTSTPITVTRSGSTATVSSGSVVLMQNLGKLKINMEFENVSFTPSCVYPTGGTVSLKLTAGAETSKLFSGRFSNPCGNVSIDGVSTTLEASNG